MANNTKLHGVAVCDSISLSEANLLAAYRAAADDARHDMILMAQAVASVNPRQRPALMLVQVGKT